MITASDFTFVLSGGTSNRDPNRSLGGEPSSFPIATGVTLDNLFDDVTPRDTKQGTVAWRCFYVFNDSETDALYNANLFILPTRPPGGSAIDLGFLIQDENQAINLGSVPSGGSVAVEYNGNILMVEWGGSIDAFSAAMASALETYVGPGLVVVAHDTDSRFVLNFLDAKFHPPLAFQDNTLGVSIASSVLRSGSPVNTVTVAVDSATTPPTGMTYFTPTSTAPVQLGTLFPGDGFPVWVRRTAAGPAPPPSPDGFTVRLSGQPAQVPAAPSPLPPPQARCARSGFNQRIFDRVYYDEGGRC